MIQKCDKSVPSTQKASHEAPKSRWPKPNDSSQHEMHKNQFLKPNIIFYNKMKGL